MSLAGKLALVTGGGRGIGRAIALDFALHGADIVVAARTKPEIESVAAEIHDLGRESIAIPTDMTDEASIQNLVFKTFETYGKIDILVNNAGVTIVVPVIDMKTEDFDRVMNVNVRGMFICTRETLPIMKKQKYGTIINISSGFGIEGQPLLSAYCASKAAILLFSDSLSKEERRIKVYVINPGLIDTQMATIESGQKYPPEAIATIATYLASPENKFPSGMVIKQLQLEYIKEAINPLIQGRTYSDFSALFKDVKKELNEKILRNIEKYKIMMPYIFKDYLES